MISNDLLSNTHPQAESTHGGIRRIGTVELIKNLQGLLRTHADTVIFHRLDVIDVQSVRDPNGRKQELAVLGVVHG